MHHRWLLWPPKTVLFLSYGFDRRSMYANPRVVAFPWDQSMATSPLLSLGTMHSGFCIQLVIEYCAAWEIDRQSLVSRCTSHALGFIFHVKACLAWSGQAVLEAATSASPKFFLGTDSAPHPQHAKVRRTHGLLHPFIAANLNVSSVSSLVLLSFFK